MNIITSFSRIMIIITFLIMLSMSKSNGPNAIDTEYSLDHRIPLMNLLPAKLRLTNKKFVSNKDSIYSRKQQYKEFKDWMTMIRSLIPDIKAEQRISGTIKVSKVEATVVVSKEEDTKIISKEEDTKIVSKKEDTKIVSKEETAKIVSKEDATIVASKEEDTKIVSKEDPTIAISKEECKAMPEVNPRNITFARIVKQKLVLTWSDCSVSYADLRETDDCIYEGMIDKDTTSTVLVTGCKGEDIDVQIQSELIGTWIFPTKDGRALAITIDDNHYHEVLENPEFEQEFPAPDGNHRI